MVIHRVAAAEVDEVWPYGGKKTEPRWLWHAIDPYKGAVLAYVFDRRKDAVLQVLRQPNRRGARDRRSVRTLLFSDGA